MACLGLLIEAERKGKGTIPSFQINQICSYRQLKSKVDPLCLSSVNPMQPKTLSTPDYSGINQGCMRGFALSIPSTL